MIGKWSPYSEAHLHGVTNPILPRILFFRTKKVYYFIKEHGIVLQSIVCFPLKQYRYLCYKLVKISPNRIIVLFFRGGFKVIPDKVEFWQGQSSRLHDRIVFRKQEADEVLDENVTKKGDNGWVYERLSP